MNPILILGLILLAIAEGIIAGFLSIYVFNRIPARWLCDYGIVPSKEMWGERIPKKPWIWILPLAFTGTALFLLRQGLSYQTAALFALWLLLLIGMADQKYGIIPDQLVVALAVTALGFLPHRPEAKTMLFGALIGGGCFLFAGLLGKLLFRRDAIGFGDVKLLTALGLVLGIEGIIPVLLFSVFSSGLVFGCLLIAGVLEKNEERPIGPFICASAALVILFRPEIAVVTQSLVGF